MGLADVIYGTGDRPSGGDVVFGTQAPSPQSGVYLNFVVSPQAVGTVLVAVVVRSDDILCSDPVNWVRKVNGRGAGNFLLDVWVRRIVSPSENPSVLFLSTVEQELVGGMLAFNDVDYDDLIEAIEDIAFVDDINPPAPGSLAESANDTAIGIWASDDAVTWTPPPGMTELDDYESSLLATRSILIAVLGGVGSFPIVDLGAATASAPTSGRAWTIILRYLAPVITVITPIASSTGRLNGVIQRFATGTYVVTRVPDGQYIDGEYVLDDPENEIAVTGASASLDTLTAPSHGHFTGDGPVRLIGNDLPAGLDNATPYWLVRINNDTLHLALSRDDAMTFTVVDIIGDGAFSFVASFTRFQSTMCIQPAKGRDLESIPEADRTSDMKLVFVAEPLLTRMPGQEPDSVLYKGEDWTVITSEEWEHWGSTHWRCIIQRDEVT